MRPLDPRLLRYAGATRGLLAGAAGVGLAGTAATIGYAVVLAGLVAHVVRGGSAATMTGGVVALLVIVVARAAIAWYAEYFPRRTAVRMTSQIRRALLTRVTTEDRAAMVDRSPARLINLATTGVAGLETYAARYLPQLVLATMVPLGIVVYLGFQDVESAIVIAVTIPLIPMFMALVGWHTQKTAHRQYRLLDVLAHRFTDVVTGLTTLKAFGRSRAQAELIRRTDAEHKSATMKTLRIAFLSALVLELLATLSVALVAVSIGLRLVSGSLDLHTGLTVLLVAPEAYLALRAVGTHFHASVDGLTAAEAIFAILDQPVCHSGHAAVPSRWTTITLRDIAVQYAGARAPVRLPDFTCRAGDTTLLAGPSGVGKSTALNLIAGVLQSTSGEVLIDATPLDLLERAAWSAQTGYVAQSPYIPAGTVADNIRMLSSGSAERVDHALYVAGLAEFVMQLPRGADTMLREGAPEWSQGQRQRLAIARAVAARPQLLLLDEATSALDHRTEYLVLQRIRQEFAGRTIVIAGHRDATRDVADQVIDLGAVARV
ncbi:thiol reductant ABC exporter CydD subunit [Antricoccus suffuscus]|uniref:Thiol reductant ABC exporter CydD subunit n=1 Tax=Antricoccus suffuscus TaxID=1629062 RepID=A0A2T1A0J4_9ACTN|nr:thiol reductant ABC exporter subunit CydD [Antricoccus suffuscus]PRZ42054.1 thiol reductant ABC exporter CydD subunit [Antricoccus suffuscus]